MKNTWNLKLLYKSDDDPAMKVDQKNTREAVDEFISKWEKNTKYLVEPKTLLTAMEEFEELISTKDAYLLKQDLYYFLRTSEDSINTELKAQVNKFNEIKVQLINDLQFFTYKISKIDESKQIIFLEYQPLNKYKHILETLFANAKHLLTEQEEKLLQITQKTSNDNWVNMVEEFIAKEERYVKTGKEKNEKLSFDQLLSLACYNKKETIRDDATKKVNSILKKHVYTATKEINSILEYKNKIDELKKLDRPDKSRLLEDDITEEFIETLIETVYNRFDISHRFYKLKAKLLGKEKIKYNERVVSIGKFNKKYNFTEAKSLVFKVYSSLDKTFYDIANSFFNEHRIDVFPKKGKIGGAYCTITSRNLPDYIMLNHNDEIADVTTIAHEIGHGVNHELIRRNNSELNYVSSKSTAEVASTFFEDFTIEEMMNDLNDEDKLTFLLKKLDSDVSAIFRQIALYRFELELHKSTKEKGYLSEKDICTLFGKHMSSYLGDAVIMDEGSSLWWVYWSHIRSFFYVYSYASGQLISKALQSLVKEDSKNISKVMKLFSAGGTKSPKDIFTDLGIDITDKNFWNKGLDEVEALLNTCESLAKKLGKI